MNRLLFLLLASAATLAVSMLSCSNNAEYENRIAALTHERDSISAMANASKAEYEEVYRYITGIENALDSIATEEKILTLGKAEGDRPFTRMELKERVQKFGLLLQRQREYIRSLEDSLRNTDGTASHLLGMITTPRQQLDAKDSELVRLRSALQNERKSVAQLQESFGALAETNQHLEVKNSQLEQAMVMQNEAANIGYVLIKSKKELEKLGILSGGFLKKTKINYSAFNSEAFRQVDIRSFTNFTIDSKKAKLITPAPAGSYKLEKTADRQ